MLQALLANRCINFVLLFMPMPLKDAESSFQHINDKPENVSSKVSATSSASILNGEILDYLIFASCLTNYKRGLF